MQDKTPTNFTFGKQFANLLSSTIKEQHIAPTSYDLLTIHTKLLIESAIKARCLIKPVVLPVATIVYQNHASFRDHVISLCKRQGCYCSLSLARRKAIY